MQKNPSSYFDYLKNIKNDVGLIHLKQSEISPDIKELINYLTNKNISPDLWRFTKLPIHIFTQQFNSQLLITITSDDRNLDDFSKNFAEGKKILTSADFKN